MPRSPRENDRYTRASRREQWADELRVLLRSPRLLAVLAFLAGGWLFLQLTAPKLVQLPDIAASACIHVPTSANGDVTSTRPIGTDAEVGDVLTAQGAAIAPCNGSHSHEVAAVFTDADAAGAPYPGQGALAARHEAACEAAFATYVGHAVAGSTYALLVVVQRETGWTAGQRAGACLVSDAAGAFLMAPAKGTGR